MTCIGVGRRRGTTAPATEQQRADRRLKWQERVVHSDNLGDEVKVDEEQNDPEVDQRKRSRAEEDSTHLQQEDDGSDQTRLDFAETHRQITSAISAKTF